MKVITEERYKDFLSEISQFTPDEILWLADNLSSKFQEIDTLTVSKLRPMSDATNFAGDIQVFYSGDYRESEIYYYNKASERHFDIDSDPLFWDDDYTIGFVPAIIYKPELAGDGE